MNLFSRHDIVLQLQWQDILVGMTIYLKTSVDFAIFIGNLMARFGGVRNRIAIELGTAAGNALGTMLILAIWNFFRDIDWILALMIIIAALVLFRLAEDGLEHALASKAQYPDLFTSIALYLQIALQKINKLCAPILNKLVPHISMNMAGGKLNFISLFAFSFTVPFILGLDDFCRLCTPIQYRQCTWVFYRRTVRAYGFKYFPIFIAK